MARISRRNLRNIEIDRKRRLDATIQDVAEEKSGQKEHVGGDGEMANNCTLLSVNEQVHSNGKPHENVCSQSSDGMSESLGKLMAAKNDPISSHQAKQNVVQSRTRAYDLWNSEIVSLANKTHSFGRKSLFKHFMRQAKEANLKLAKRFTSKREKPLKRLRQGILRDETLFSNERLLEKAHKKAVVAKQKQRRIRKNYRDRKFFQKLLAMSKKCTKDVYDAEMLQGLSDNENASDEVSAVESDAEITKPFKLPSKKPRLTYKGRKRRAKMKRDLHSQQKEERIKRKEAEIDRIDDILEEIKQEEQHKAVIMQRRKKERKERNRIVDVVKKRIVKHKKKVVVKVSHQLVDSLRELQEHGSLNRTLKNLKNNNMIRIQKPKTAVKSEIKKRKIRRRKLYVARQLKH